MGKKLKKDKKDITADFFLILHAAVTQTHKADGRKHKRTVYTAYAVNSRRENDVFFTLGPMVESTSGNHEAIMKSFRSLYRKKNIKRRLK